MAWAPIQADLEAYLGSPGELVQLADPTGVGTADPALVQRWLDAGAAEVRGLVGRKYNATQLEALDAPSSQLLQDAAAALAARVAWERGAGGKAMPEFVASAAARKEQWAREVGNGSQTLGYGVDSTPAPINQAVGVMDSDKLGQKVSIAGFRRGFR